jgi:hypothetical protein
MQLCLYPVNSKIYKRNICMRTSKYNHICINGFILQTYPCLKLEERFSHFICSFLTFACRLFNLKPMVLLYVSVRIANSIIFQPRSMFRYT